MLLVQVDNLVPIYAFGKLIPALLCHHYIPGVDHHVTVILPSPSKSGKGLAVDTFLTARGQDGTGEFWGKESEVLLPRDTALLFLGISTSTDHQGKPIAIFQRMDK